MLENFRRSRENKMVAGVCAAIAQSSGLELSLVRLLFAAGILFTGSGLFWLYVLLWLVVPEQDTGRVAGKELLDSVKGAAEQRVADRRPSSESRREPTPEQLRTQPYPWESDHIKPSQ